MNKIVIIAFIISSLLIGCKSDTKNAASIYGSWKIVNTQYLLTSEHDYVAENYKMCFGTDVKIEPTSILSTCPIIGEHKKLNYTASNLVSRDSLELTENSSFIKTVFLDNNISEVEMIKTSVSIDNSNPDYITIFKINDNKIIIWAVDFLITLTR